MALRADHLPDAPQDPPRADQRHIIDVLIEERCPQLAGSPSWPLVRPAIYRLLHYKEARRMADDIGPMSGRDAMEYMSALLSLRLDVRGLERIPKAGRCVIVANHPTGIADGAAVYDALKPVRPDIMFFANADAHRVCPGFHDSLVAVEWVTAKRTIEKTKQTLRAAHKAFAEERPIMIFPAGKLARLIDGEIQDPVWEPSAVSLARKHDAAMIPIWMDGPYPFFFHTFDRISKELRDITLFHELLNKKGKLFSLKVGPPIPPSRLAGAAEDVTLALKRYVEKDLPRDMDRAFPGV
ncbi:MAG: 1-acyl-sn-glycerol-3-phosphate acyltransferase [Hyphomonadaceae bacterium]|nr:1-acyl-sn-glycerol-3-phosphate acyltransferase [Hyphomonadaceae bacterium]